MNECNSINPNQNPYISSLAVFENLLNNKENNKEIKQEELPNQFIENLSGQEILDHQTELNSSQKNDTIIEGNQLIVDEFSEDLLIKGIGNEVATIYEKSVIIFSSIYQETGTSSKVLSSVVYSQQIKEAENNLEIIKNIHRQNHKIGTDEEILLLENQFNEMYQLIPEGESVLLNKDLKQIRQLSEVPTNKTFYSSFSEYYEPTVSLMDIAKELQSFCDDNNYAGTSISMKAESFYKLHEGMMTIIGFKKKQKNYPDYFYSWTGYNYMMNYIKKKPEEKITELKNLIENKVIKWGYKNYQIGHMNKIEEKSKWGLYVLLFHKKVE